MTAQVLGNFTHEYNALEVARQEYELAREDYREACRNFSSTDQRRMGKWNAALLRKNLSWQIWWALKRAG